MFNNNALVSIIIPTYNREALISETLDSVLSQTYSNWECIVVDDNSNDGTLDILSFFTKKDDRIKYIVKSDKSKRGASLSRNLGLQIAKGEFIQFLDSDDILAPNKLEIQIGILQKENRYAITTCKWGRFDNISLPLKIIENNVDYNNFENTKDYFDLIGKHGGFFPPLNFLMRKDLINYSGYWNESLTINDDGEFFFRLLSNADKIIFSFETYVLYRNSSNDNLSLLNSESKAISLLNSWRIIEANYVSKYNDVDSDYINKKKTSVYFELKRHYPLQIKKNKEFFSKQIKNDTLLLKLTKLKKRINNRLKLILKL